MSGVRLGHPCSSLLHSCASASGQGNAMPRSPHSRMRAATAHHQGHYLAAPLQEALLTALLGTPAVTALAQCHCPRAMGRRRAARSRLWARAERCSCRRGHGREADAEAECAFEPRGHVPPMRLLRRARARAEPPRSASLRRACWFRTFGRHRPLRSRVFTLLGVPIAACEAPSARPCEQARNLYGKHVASTGAPGLEALASCSAHALTSHSRCDARCAGRACAPLRSLGPWRVARPPPGCLAHCRFSA